METPPPNDSLASLNPPVGDCVCSFRRDSNKVLNIITNGYILPSHTNPKFTQDTRPIKKDLALASCVQSLLTKNVIERVKK